MCSILKIHASVLILTAIFAHITAVYCPYYCRCSVKDFLRHVICIRQNLISVELDVPTNVQWLELSYNYISELKDYIFQDLGLERIVLLDLSHNTINSISLNAFHGLESIKFIDLSGNHLYRIDPHTFEYNPSLQHLNLNSNPLRHIPAYKPFIISSSLKILEISHCRLSYFPPDTFSSLPSLHSLNISNNDVLILNENILDHLFNLTNLDITNTAIKCDASSTYLINWALRNSARIIGSPCLNKVKEFTPDHKVEPKKFEKMVINELYNDDEDDDYNMDYEDYFKNECICPDGNDGINGKLIAATTILPITESKKIKQRISQQDHRSMLWLTFLNGLITGAAISSSIILFWIYCSKYRTRRNARRAFNQEVMQYENIPSGTPPPSYGDLF